MKKKLRILALCLVLVQLVMLFAACNNGEKPTTAAPSTTGKPATPTTGGTSNNDPTDDGEVTTTPREPGGENPPEALCLVENGKAQYVVVIPMGVASELSASIAAFVDDLQSITGAKFTKNPDSYQPDGEREIVIGAWRNRPDVQKVEQETPYTGYTMATSGERVALIAYKGAHYDKALQYFLEALYEEDGNWYVDVDMINFTNDFAKGGLETPKFSSQNASIQGSGVYWSMEETLVVSYDKPTEAEFTAYVASLEEAGYTKYTENTIGQVRFATYTKEDGNTVHTQYNPKDRIVTLNFFKGQYLPAPEPADFDKVTDASANYLRRYGYDGWGLSQIVQLGDGSYIIIDGGKWDQTDFNNMIKFMKDNKPASHAKPIVSLWLMTHPHEDHVEMFAYKATEFAKHIDVKMLGYNIPAEPCSEVDATGRYWNEYYHHALKAQRDKAFPEAIIWTAHTGQKLYVADAEVEILFTHEDYWPGQIYSANDCNTNYRITIDGACLMSLGDSDRGGVEMTKMYGNALEADMVQASHHGANGPLEMYLAMDAKVVFWPDDRNDIETERWEYGVNKPWVHTQWTRVDENGNTVAGDRIHYTASETSKVLFKSFNK